MSAPVVPLQPALSNAENAYKEYQIEEQATQLSLNALLAELKALQQGGTWQDMSQAMILLPTVMQDLLSGQGYIMGEQAAAMQMSSAISNTISDMENQFNAMLGGFNIGAAAQFWADYTALQGLSSDSLVTGLLGPSAVSQINNALSDINSQIAGAGSQQDWWLMPVAGGSIIPSNPLNDPWWEVQGTISSQGQGNVPTNLTTGPAMLTENSWNMNGTFPSIGRGTTNASGSITSGLGLDQLAAAYAPQSNGFTQWGIGLTDFYQGSTNVGVIQAIENSTASGTTFGFAWSINTSALGYTTNTGAAPLAYLVNLWGQQNSPPAPQIRSIRNDLQTLSQTMGSISQSQQTQAQSMANGILQDFSSVHSLYASIINQEKTLIQNLKT